MTIELGGNITLTGFSGREFTELIVIKKIVGQYARRLSDSVSGFSRLSVRLEEVHGGAKHTIHVSAVVDGHELSASETDHNLFVTLDACLKKATEQAHRQHERHATH